MLSYEQKRKRASDIFDQGRELVINYIVHLEIKIEVMEERLKMIEARLNQDNHNSSLPPSSDGLNHFPKNSRKKSKRPSGGQKGHNGTTLKISDMPDTVIVHTVKKCSWCGYSLKKVESLHHDKRQVIDIPRIETTERGKNALNSHKLRQTQES